MSSTRSLASPNSIALFCLKNRGFCTPAYPGAMDRLKMTTSLACHTWITGMPVIQVWHAKEVVIFKRSMAPGYAGVQNPLFFKQNSAMLFGDAKDRVEDILRDL